MTEHNRRAIYRRSAVADYHICRDGVAFDTLRHAECPLWSPDSNRIAYIRSNNLFIKNIIDGATVQVTDDGAFNNIINGKPDWVYEEEFAFNRAFDFSIDGQYLAWIKFDESKVPIASFSVYPDSIYSYKYPKAGDTNSTVSVWTYDMQNGVTKKMSIPMDADGYIPRIFFTKDKRKLAVCTLNRHQNIFRIYIVNPEDGIAKQIFEETDKCYLEEDIYSRLTFYDNNTFVLWSERSGYKHLYLYDIEGRLLRQITHGNYDVSQYYGMDSHGTVYYASHEQSPLNQNVYKITKKNRKTCLTPQSGWHTAKFSSDFKTFTDVFSDINTPNITSLYDNKGHRLRVIDTNDSVRIANAENGIVELFSFTTSENVVLNGWMLKPQDFNPEYRYPVIMYQYSGPGSQEVQNSWGNGFYPGLQFERKMVKKGVIFVCVDGRGTGCRGAEWKKCTYLNMGDKESRDQVETALWLSRQSYVDKDRIAIWGWSFGGFNTLLAMSDPRHVFRCGVAVAPVTDWRFYDSVYTERFMRTPQENPDGYNISPLHHCNTLHGNLLLVHGLADDNVHFTNTAEYQKQLVQLGYPFESQYYTNKNHSILGTETRKHLFNRIERFFTEHLIVNNP